MAVRSEQLRSIDFEVFGRVQGVFFRKYTQQQAASLGLKGWCKNTSRGTVTGSLEGPSYNVSLIYYMTSQNAVSASKHKAQAVSKVYFVYKVSGSDGLAENERESQQQNR